MPVYRHGKWFVLDPRLNTLTGPYFTEAEAWDWIGGKV
jgi:hypothetical protein